MLLPNSAISTHMYQGYGGLLYPGIIVLAWHKALSCFRIHPFNSL